MDEGVDPTHMCQTLVDKVFQSKQLKAVADPEILILFEDWLEELEEEIITKIKKFPLKIRQFWLKVWGYPNPGLLS